MIREFADVGIDFGVVAQRERHPRKIGPQPYVLLNEVYDLPFAHGDTMQRRYD